MIYELCEWEENGYDDSDGYSAVWNSETRVVERVMTWTTRGGRSGACEGWLPLTSEVLQQAIDWLTDYLTTALIKADNHDVFEPDNAVNGAEMMLLEDYVWHDKRAGAKVEIKAGTWGDVFWCGAFGTFYRNGYKHPGGSNRRVGLRLAPRGQRVFVPLHILRLRREPLAADEIQKRARDLAQGCQFGKALSGRHAWDTTNAALALLKSTSTKLVENAS